MTDMRDGQVTDIFTDEYVAASGSVTSDPLLVSPSGSFDIWGVQWSITSSTGTVGAVTIDALISLNNHDFIPLTSSLATGQSGDSGPGSDGKNIVFKTDMPIASFKLRATETSTTEGVTINAWGLGKSKR
jgi:hypothetical protein